MKDINRHVKVFHTTIRPFQCSEPGCEFQDVDDSRIADHYNEMHPDRVPQVVSNGFLLEELNKLARTLFTCEIREVSTFEQLVHEPSVKMLDEVGIVVD